MTKTINDESKFEILRKFFKPDKNRILQKYDRSTKTVTSY